MCATDIAARRRRDLERYHRRTAERKAQGFCLKCGKRPPAPHRTQCEPCAEKQRARDLARYHQRTAERVARGLCPKCGKVPPAPERSQCGPCLEKDAAAGRARDARLRAAGIPRRDPGKARIAERRRRERQISERRAAGLCPECGKAPPAPGRTVCGPCGEERRTAARARYARGKAEGKLYGGRNVETRRRIGREKSARRLAARLAAGLCTSCGKRPSADDGTTCEPCREARRAFERDRYAARRAAGLCGYCGEPTLDGGSRCGSCAVREWDRAPRPREEERRRPPALREAPGRGPLHRLRRALARGGAVRTLRAPVLRALDVRARAAALPAAVHRRRAHHRRGPRHLRQLGRGGHVPRLRAPLARRGRGPDRPVPDGDVQRLGVGPAGCIPR